MMSPKVKYLILASALYGAVCSPATAQYGGYGGYGGSYGGYGGVGYGVPGAYGTYGGRYGGFGRGGYGSFGALRPYGNFGGYAGGYYPTLLYRSPSSFKPSDDPYAPEKPADALQRSMQKFRDLREDHRKAEGAYSDETYKRNHPFDDEYYNRLMTP